MNTEQLINTLYTELKNQGLWFVTKKDSNWLVKPKKYYTLDEYGELKDKSKVEKEINNNLGDGAETILEAVRIFINDGLADGSIACNCNLSTVFKDKPVDYSENAVEVKNIEPKYIEPQITGSNKQVESKPLNETYYNELPNKTGKDLSDFKSMLDTLNNNGKQSRRGKWNIGNGGYDLWYEIYYNGLPVIQCINGKVNNITDKEVFEFYAKLFADICEYEYEEEIIESKKLDEIASRVPGTEVQKKPAIQYEELTLDDIEGSMSEEVAALYYQLGIDIDKTWENVQNDMEYGYLKLAIINDKTYIVYDDRETQAYCSGRDNNNIPLVFIENIEDLVKDKKQEDIFDDVINGKATYGVYDDKDERNLKDRYKEPTYAKRNKIRNFKDDKFTQRSVRDIINDGVTHISYEKMPNEKSQVYKDSKKIEGVVSHNYTVLKNGLDTGFYCTTKQEADDFIDEMQTKGETGKFEIVASNDKSKKIENVQSPLEEENNKSANTISDMFQSKDFDSDSKMGRIVMRTSNLFNTLSDKGYDVQVSFDNGESTNVVLLGQQGGQVNITIDNDNQPLRAYANGSFEITEDSIKILNDIQQDIKDV